MTERDLTRIRWSELRELRRSPAHYRYRCDHPQPPSAAMSLGSLVHAMVLEPGTVPSRYRAQQYDGRTAQGKAEREAAAAAGITLVPSATWDQACAMATAVLTHPVARKWLVECERETEVELQWESEEGELLGGKADLIVGRRVVDLKTCRSADARTCQGTIARMAYNAQLAYYSWGLKAARGVDPEAPAIIWVESEAPYCVRVQEMSHAWVESGARLFLDLLQLRRECERSGHWPGYSDDLEVSEPPMWMTDDEEDEG